MKTSYKILALSFAFYIAGFFSGKELGVKKTESNIKSNIENICQTYMNKERYWRLNHEGLEALDKARQNYHDLSKILFGDTTISINDVVLSQIERERRYSETYGPRVDTSNFKLIPKH